MDTWELSRKKQITGERARKVQALLQDNGYFDIRSWMPGGGDLFNAVLGSFLVDYFNFIQGQQREPLQLSDLQKVLEDAFAAHRREVEATSEPFSPAG